MPRESTTRNAFARLFVAFVAFMTCIPIVLIHTPQAHAFINTTLTPDAGTNPAVSVVVSHGSGTPSGLATPKQGDTYTYTATFTLTNMSEPAVTNEVVLTVNADMNSPWTSVPTAADFAGGGSTPTLSNCSTTSCTATYANITADSVITFTHTATVGGSLLNGELVIGTAQGVVNTTPSIQLAGSPSFIGDNGTPNDCSGTFTFTQQLTGSGGWLMDIHFADIAGQGKVQLAQPSNIVAHNDNPSGNKNTIKVVDEHNVDITASVFPSGVYAANDPNSPYFPDDEIQTNHPDARWLDSMHWPYDPSTFTGSTWLPAGSTVTVTRHVTNTNCLPGGFASDWSTSRPFGMSLEVARPMTKAHGFDSDIFSMPGSLPPLDCAVNVWSLNTAPPNNAPSLLQQWRPGTSTLTVSSISNSSAALAATDRYPHLVFGMTSANPGSLYMVNTAVSPAVYTTLPTTGRGLYDIAGAAFDPAGRLWMVSSAGAMLYLNAADIDALVAGGSAVVKRGANMTNPADIAFDGDGNLWYVELTATSSNSTGQLARIVAGSPFTTDSATLPITRFGAPTQGLYRSLAFVGDKLLLGRAFESSSNGPANNTVYEVNRTTGAFTPYAATGYTVDRTSDWATCSFPKASTPPSGPQFKWQKSVVNPNGSVAPAGTTGHTHTLSADGTIAVRYLITVTNTGNAAGTSPMITDNIRVPSGFTITDVTLDGISQGAVNQVLLPGVSLNPLDGASTSHTYEVIVHAKTNPATLTPAQLTEANTCTTTGPGTPTNGGFFNTATYQSSDADGADNNDACVPVQPEVAGQARLALIKKIVDGAGNEITGSTDSQFFTLIAGGPTHTAGSSASTGTIAVDQQVVPGAYTLAEQGNDGGSVSGTYTPGTWSCVNRNTSAPFTVTNRQITIVNGDNVACTITNERAPQAHVVKTASTPTSDNEHVGEMITPNADGTFTADYTITVTNTSSFVANTGPINDFFVVPAGLAWNTPETAAITFDPGTTGATLSPSPLPSNGHRG